MAAEPAPPRRELSRVVLFTGVMLGTALTILAGYDGARLHVGGSSLPDWIQAVIGMFVLWLILMAITSIAAELTRRHGKTAAVAGGRAARRHTGRGYRWALRTAGDRWQSRTAAAGADGDEHGGVPYMAHRAHSGTPDGQPHQKLTASVPGSVPDAASGDDGPWLLTVRSRSGRPVNAITGGPQDTITVRDRTDLERRLAGVAADPDLVASVAAAPPAPGTAAGRPPVTALAPEIELELKRQVCARHTEDGLRPDEVLINPDGTITIDRRRTYPQATPFTAGTWSLTSDDELELKRQVCARHTEDGLRPDEVLINPDGTITIDRRRTYPQAAPFTAGTWSLTSDDAGSPAPATTEGTDMTDSTPRTGPRSPYARDDSAIGAMFPARRPDRRGPAPDAGGAWKQLAADTGDFEPEDDNHLLTWMRGEVTGMTAYAESITEVYETGVNSIGLDPVSLAALHDYAEAAADAAAAMAQARAKFAAHYAEVREFAANGGVLPHNGRWITGDGEA